MKTKGIKLAKPKKIKQVAKKGTLMRKADTLFSKHVRSLGYCELAGKDNITCSNVLQTMHITTRGNRRLRYDEMNVICGCSGHHIFYTYNPSRFDLFVAAFFPKKWAYVQKHQNEKVKVDYQEIIDKYKEEK